MLEDHKQLRKLQLEQYKILQSVNDLCSKYGIEYYLLYGLCWVLCATRSLSRGIMT